MFVTAGPRAATAATPRAEPSARVRAILDARTKGFEGVPCDACGALTMVRNGTCLKCTSCGATSGCS